MTSQALDLLPAHAELVQPLSCLVAQLPPMGCVRQWLLFFALLSFSVANVAYCEEDVESEELFDIVEKAFLLVRHKIDTVDLVQGKNTSVVVELYNAGNR